MKRPETVTTTKIYCSYFIVCPLDANSIYGSIFGIVTQEIQQDRIGELSWHTIFRELKKIDRKKKAAAAEEEGNEKGEEDSNSNE